MRLLRTLVSAFVLLWLLTVASSAQPPSEAATIFDQGLKPDVRVIIDISGSMKQNDPQNLRRPALELLVQLFPEASKAGVWTFGQWVNNLVPSKPVNEAWRQMAHAEAAKINSVALHTNIPEALSKATHDINRLDPAYQTHLILLTDGMVDVSKNPDENIAARQRIIDEILPGLKTAGIIVHTVALSKNADSELMERLAIETGGLAAIAETADDLTRIFLQAFDAAAPAEEVPLEGNSFLVDSSIEEFTVLLFRKAGSTPAVLVSPDNQQYTELKHPSDIRWFAQQNYDLVTVKRPYEGEWVIQADLEPNSRVTIVSNLSLKTTRLSKSLFIGDESNLSAVLMEQGSTITNAEFLELVDVSMTINKRADDQSWNYSLSELDPTPADGVFATNLDMLYQTGMYDITIHAMGKTFQRQQKQTVEVRRNFAVGVSSSESNLPLHTLTVRAQNPAIDFDSLKITAAIRIPDGTSSEGDLQPINEREWQITLPSSSQSGVYQVELGIQGQFTRGEIINFKEPVSVDHYVEGSDFVEPVQQAVAPEPEPELEAKPETKPEAVEEKPQPEPEEEIVEQVEPVTEEGTNWQQIGMYAGLAIANILVFVIGYFAYRTITSGRSSSSVLDDSDDVDVTDESTEEAETIADTTTDSEEDIEEELEDELEPEPEIEQPQQEAVALDEEVEDQEPELPEETVDEELVVEVEDVDISAEDFDLDEDDLADSDLEETAQENNELESDELPEGIDEMGEDVLEEASDEEEADDMLDLPDDAIDIDPTADDEK